MLRSFYYELAENGKIDYNCPIYILKACIRTEGDTTLRKILIADDEKIERNGVRRLLQKEDENLEFLEARNGKEALGIVRQEKPDILFSDIKMPFMTGLELARQVKEISPETMIIIFSGYSDFDYAREAIKYGVLDYVLKPIDPAELRKAYQKALELIEKREKTSAVTQKNQDFLEEYFLQKYIYSDRADVLAEAADIIDISWWKDVGRVVLMEAATDFFEECNEDFPQLLEQELQIHFYYLNIEKRRSLLLFQREIKVDYRVMAEHIHSYMWQKYQVKCYVAVSSELGRDFCMPQAFQELELLMENRFYRQDIWVFLPDMDLDKKDNYEIVVQLMDKIKEDIRLRDISHLWEHFHKLKEHRQNVGQFSHIYVKFSCSNIIQDLYKEMNYSVEKCNDVVEKLYMCNTMQEILDMVEENIRVYEDTIFANQSSARSDVEKVKSYIYEHYAEELSVEILGNKIYLSPGYMSYIFKKETGEGLSYFIRRYRLEKAGELLKNTDMKIVQICTAVGFSNSSYFCKSFREYYGCSPEKFRKGEGGNEENNS